MAPPVAVVTDPRRVDALLLNNGTREEESFARKNVTPQGHSRHHGSLRGVSQPPRGIFNKRTAAAVVLAPLVALALVAFLVGNKGSLRSPAS